MNFWSLFIADPTIVVAHLKLFPFHIINV